LQSVHRKKDQERISEYISAFLHIRQFLREFNCRRQESKGSFPDSRERDKKREHLVCENKE